MSTANGEKNEEALASSNIGAAEEGSPAGDESSSPIEADNTSEKTWEPIRGQKKETLSRPTSMREISRTRSQNGYGCDDDEENDVEQQAGEDKDPWEVSWENGDLDPMNPRSMRKAKKWAVVLTVSLASLCV